MLRVVIADDEERICRLIEMLADWDRLQMEIVGVAGNGPDAIAMVSERHPDILITDIRMPGCDGLEVIKQARAVSDPPEMIIISGYAQFDYAQTAIQYGVGEYLLKPINKEALNLTLEKLGKRCAQKHAAKCSMESLRMESETGRERLRLTLVSDMLDGRYKADTPQALESMYYFRAQGCVLRTFVLQMDYDIDRFKEQSLAIVRGKVQDLFAPVLGSLCNDYLLCDRDSAVYGVISYDEARKADVRSGLRDALNRLVAMKTLFGAVVFSLALGKQADAAHLASSLLNASERIAERLTEGTERMLEEDAPPSELRADELLSRFAQAATHAIDVMSVPEAVHAAEALLKAALAVPHVRGRELLGLVTDAGVLFVSRLGLDNRETVLLDFTRRIGQCSHASELGLCLSNLISKQLEGVEKRRKSEAAQPIRQAKQYIQAHFANALTLEEVSAAIGFSVSYFSTLFKKETGEGFAKYVTRVRMEEARNLLRETRLPVTEVCARVGYGDVKHFTHTFKAATGLTPGEFRKLYG